MDELIEFLENFDFAYDVRADYASFREEMGLTATIRRLREEYSEPLEDPDGLFQRTMCSRSRKA